MSDDQVTPWLEWVREIQALCQTGLTYSKSEFDTARYRRLLEIAAEMTAHQTGCDAGGVLADFLKQPGYATPKVDVRGAVVRDDRILLVQERSDGRWCMPGGWADVGELPSAMVIREVQEESGFEVEPRKVIGVYDANRGGVPVFFYHAYKVVFHCELIGGEARPSSETTAVGFFPFGELPPLSSARTNERHLAEVQAHLQDPQRPAAFD